MELYNIQFSPVLLYQQLTCYRATGDSEGIQKSDSERGWRHTAGLSG
jgi:hypothetical protein